MTIDRVGAADPVKSYARNQESLKKTKSKNIDSVVVSSEARQSAEMHKAMEAVKAAPDIRMDRVEDVKRRMQDANYISDTVLKATAGAIMQELGL